MEVFVSFFFVKSLWLQWPMVPVCSMMVAQDYIYKWYLFSRTLEAYGMIVILVAVLYRCFWGVG